MVALMTLSPSQLSNIADQQRTITVETGAVSLDGLLACPPQVRGLVILAHGTDAGEHAEAYGVLARALYDAQLASLDVCLFTPEEQRFDELTDYFRENTGIMEQRLSGIADWLLRHPQFGPVIHNEFGTMSDLINGYFGIGACASAALLAAAHRPDVVNAVVAVAPTLQSDDAILQQIHTPTLLLTWKDDPAQLKRYEDMQNRLVGPHRLEQVTSPATADSIRQSMEEIASSASTWFARWLKPIV
jgi:putative phosphoribosyl transferase